MKTEMRLPFQWLWLAALIAVLAGCSRSPPKEKSVFEVEREKSADREWRKATMDGEYERVGHKDPKWDESAKQALEILAEIEMNDRTEQQRDFHRILQSAESAIQAGCDDPMIKYLQISIGGPDTKDTNTAVNAYLKMSSDLTGSGYPEIRKFYGCLRAAQGIRSWDWKNHGQDSGSQLFSARSHLAAALGDKNMPPGEARASCVEMLDAMKRWKAEFEPTYRQLEAPLAKNFFATTAPDAVKGDFYIGYAWEARGNGTADTVTAEGWKLFGERLKTAESALEKGWRKDPGDPFMPTKMLTVMMGEGRSLDDMNLWFERAMKAYSNNWDACNAKMTILEPKWGGSVENMLSFGRQCTTNEAWGWDVRLMIVDVHWDIASYTKDRNGYLSQPAVWSEIHAAYEQYFKANPDSMYRRNYAWYAWTAGDWDVLRQQLPYLGEDDYAYFGGKESFDAMVRDAKKHPKE